MSGERSPFLEKLPAGEITALIRGTDWSKTAIGPVEAWPVTLQGYVALILTMETPAIIFWGAELTQIYNAGYAVIMGPRHPRHYGSSFAACWPDTYPVIRPWMEKVLERGEIHQVENERIILTRHGFAEETYFTFTFHPLRDDSGRIAGILQPVVEVTSAVLADRRLAALRRLETGTVPVLDDIAALTTSSRDLPLALVFRDGELVGSGGIAAGAATDGLVAALAPTLSDVARKGAATQVNIARHQLPWEGGPSPTRAWVTPIVRRGHEPSGEVAVFGVNPMLAFDDAYRAHVESVAHGIGARLVAEGARRLEAESREREARARALVEAGRRRLYALFENAPAFVCTLRTANHVFEMVNPLYQRLVGGDRQLVGRSVREALPEVVEQGFVAILDRVFTSGEPFEGREIPVKLDRSARGTLDDLFLNFVYQPTRGPDGVIEGIDVFGFDVTDQVLSRRSAETLAAKLAESESSLRTMSELIPQQVWTARADGGLDYVNQRVVDYFGQPSEAVLGAGWQDVIHPDDLPTCVARWTNSLQTGEPYEIEFRLRRSDGVYRWFLGRAQALGGGSGKIARWFGSNTDIDEMKRIREDLKRRTDFEQYLLGIVSHDLRNPLNVIVLSAHELTTRGGLPERSAKAVERIRTSADRATRMIRDLLDFTRVRLGGEIPISRTRVSLRDVVQAVVDETQAANPQRRIDVTYSGELDGDWDSDRLAQVVQNLTSNALAYSPPMSAVRVEGRGEGPWVSLSVTNPGRPIPPDKLEAIFEPMQRATAEVDSLGRSVGLGLYIVKHIIDAHGGSIAVRSTSDDGTTFTARLQRDHRVSTA